VFRYSLAGTRATTALLAQVDPSIEERRPRRASGRGGTSPSVE